MNGLKYISWNDTSGYAVAARRYLAGLHRAGIPLTWQTMVPGHGWGRNLGYEPAVAEATEAPEALAGLHRAVIDYDTVLVHLVPEYFPHWIEREPGKRHIGYTTWETSRLPDHWPAILNQMDRVWVPSTWNRQVFKQSGVTVPIDVIPHILSEPICPDETQPHSLLNALSNDAFVFYSVNVWSRRKAPWLLLEAFWKAFSPADPVALILKTSAYDNTHPFANRRWPFLRNRALAARSYARLFRGKVPLPKTIVIAEENTPEAQVQHLHLRGNCYVSLSHAEGWGLGAFDAVSAGKPVIMTGYGGQLDFLPEELAYRVNYKEGPVEDAPNAAFYAPDQSWALPDVDHAARLLRKVVEDPDQADQRGRKLQQWAAEQFSEQAVTAKMLQILTGPGK